MLWNHVKEIHEAIFMVGLGSISSHYQTTKLDWLKLKAFADNKLDVIEKMKFV